eukprot:TRINITY_DN1674_c0_g1_i1.p1 TRINITY_DN1674_c0_g1~~TRINITY_DN1674_c0_g1_i1.p1  ORF type:complete len:470 (+),score=137.46 TRINITY_DN1674_c0_g1_i1:146-1555(+)
MQRILVAGSGIAGASVAAHLTRVAKASGRNAEVVVVDPRPAMTGSSQFSTECYRNFFTDEASVPMMQRSIELMEEMNATHDLQMSRRGYLFVATTEETAEQICAMAKVAAGFGAGEVRYHESAETYRPSTSQGFDKSLRGFDIIRGGRRAAEEIQKIFPYLNPDITCMVHCREAGWLDATGLGSSYLSEAKKNGARCIQGDLEEVVVNGGAVTGVRIATPGGEVREIGCDAFVNASGAWLNRVNAKVDGAAELPIRNDVICKTVLYDPLEKIPGSHCPFVFWKEETDVDWSDEMREALADLDDTHEGGIVNTKAWLDRQPPGQHIRPIGNKRHIILWEHAHQHVGCGNDPQEEPVFPPLTIEHFKELAVRGASSIAPGLLDYCDSLTHDTYQDAGYYCVNKEDGRPIVTQHGPENYFVLGALGGWGIMSSSGLGELCAKTVLQVALPSYHGAFTVPRLDAPVGGICPMR